MHMSQTESEDDNLEYSPDWDSISRSNFAPVMGRIVHYMFIQLLRSLPCQMLNAWKQVCQVNMTPPMMDLHEDSSAIMTILSVAITRLRDLATCSPWIEPIIVIDDAHGFYIPQALQQYRTGTWRIT